MAHRVLKTQYRTASLGDLIEAARPWGCAGPEGLIVCHKDPGAHHKVIRARFRSAGARAGIYADRDDALEAVGLRE